MFEESLKAFKNLIYINTNDLILLSSECLSCPISVYCASNLFLPNNFFLSLTFLNLAFFDLIYLIYLNYERH